MQHILDSSGRATLGDLARRRLLLAFDFDGTLAPIVADPAQACMPAATAALLARVAARYPTVAISGRSRADLRDKLGATPLHEYIGNHGAEPSAHAARYAETASGWRRALSAAFASTPGVIIEDKHLSFAVHYRLTEDPLSAEQAILRLARGLDSARVITGKCVVNIVPDGAPDKGEALLTLQRQLGCEATLFVGDDKTDEDAFKLRPTAQHLGVRVGKDPASLATHYLREQGEIDALLEQLCALREPMPLALGGRSWQG